MVERQDQPVQKQESLTFNDIVTALEGHLVVTRTDILRLFKRQIGCKATGKWKINLGPDKTAIANKETGVCYKIGTQTIRQWDKETQTMQPREIPILISREHIPEQNVDFTRTGRYSDSFEAGPGIHPADE